MLNLRRAAVPALLALLLGACSIPPHVTAASPNNIVLQRSGPYTPLQQSFDLAKAHCDQYGREFVFLRSDPVVGHHVNDAFECRAPTTAPNAEAPPAPAQSR